MITPFQQTVYDLVRKIPKGKITTYKEIGKALGKDGNIYRAIGQALNKNPFAPEVPCHRVVASNGSLGGFAQGCEAKKKLLEEEGIVIENNTIVCFQERMFFFWHAKN